MALTKPSGSMIKNETITSNNIADGTITMPKLTPSQMTGGLTIAYPLGNAASNGDTITVTSSNFDVGSLVQIGNSMVDVVIRANNTTLSFEAPSLPTGDYVSRVVGPDGRFVTMVVRYI